MFSGCFFFHLEYYQIGFIIRYLVLILDNMTMKYKKAQVEVVIFDFETFMTSSGSGTTVLSESQQAVLDQIHDCDDIEFTNSTTFSCGKHQGGGSEIIWVGNHMFIFSGNALTRTWTCAGFQ